jgi:hypothetical protein
VNIRLLGSGFLKVFLHCISFAGPVRGSIEAAAIFLQMGARRWVGGLPWRNASLVARPKSSKGVGGPFPTPFEDSGRATRQGRSITGSFSFGFIILLSLVLHFLFQGATKWLSTDGTCGDVH